MWDCELRNKANDGDGVATDDPRRTLLSQIRAPRPDDGDDGGEDINGDCQKLRICARVTETVDDGGNSGSESVKVSNRLRTRLSCFTYP